QRVTELKMRVRVLRSVNNCGSISGLGFGPVAGFLQRMPVLDPNWWVARGPVKSDAVESGGELPLSGLASPVGPGDDRRLPTCQINTTHRTFNLINHSERLEGSSRWT